MRETDKSLSKTRALMNSAETDASSSHNEKYSYLLDCTKLEFQHNNACLSCESAGWWTDEHFYINCFTCDILISSENSTSPQFTDVAVLQALYSIRA